MKTQLMAIAIYPFALICMIWVISCIKLFIIRHMQDGWLKDQLLRERWHSSTSESHRRITGGRKSFK